MLSPTNPVSMLRETSNSSTMESPLKVFGNIPVNSLLAMSKTVMFPSNPISAGKHPMRSLFKNTISFNVLAILPILLGMQPLRWLLATTTTEAGEFPKVSGIVDVNRLLFKNKASKSLLKSSGGNLPSKLLYLRSRYFKLGIVRTTIGNGPTSRLLLTSSSWRSVSLVKLFGIIPQNLFELMWNKAMSVNKPNSTGR